MASGRPSWLGRLLGQMIAVMCLGPPTVECVRQLIHH